MAHIQLKPGRIWYLIDKSEGRARWVRLGRLHKNEGEARKKAEKVLAKYHADDDYLRLGFLGDDPISLRALVDEYLEAAKEMKGADTVRVEGWILKSFAKKWGGRKARDIRGQEVKAAVRGKSASYKRTQIISFRNLYRFGVEEGYFRENPMLKLKLPEREKLPPVIMEEEVVEEVVVNSGALRPRLEILRNTGCRPIECLRLKAKDIDLKLKEIFFWGKKRGRYVPINKKLLPYFEKLLKGKAPEDLIFPGEDRHSFRRAFLKVLDGMGEKKPSIWLYAFRHFAANQFLEVSRGDLRAVAQLLGHEDIQTTLRYTWRKKKHLRRIVEKV